MSYLVLARKYRPRTFDEVVGQEGVARTLRNAILSDRVAHAYLFAGPRGIGKTTMARLLARALNCAARDEPSPEPCGEEERCEPCRLILEGNDLDVIEIDGASNRGIDEIRRLRENVKFAPARSRYKIYVVDEVHMLTTEAFNALLKTLEEPPPHVKFIFATTAPQKVPETVRSRCQIFDLRRIRSADIARRLEVICAAEGLAAPADALAAVAESTRGGMRDAISLLDQLLTLAGDRPPTVEDVEELLGVIPARAVRALVDRIAEGDAAGAVRATAEIHESGIEPDELLHQLLDHLRDLLLASVCGEDSDLIEATDDARATLRRQRASVPVERLVYMVRLLSSTLRDVRLLGEGRILVEVAIVRLARSGDVRALEDLRSDLDEVVAKLGGAPEGEDPPRAAPPPTTEGILPGTAPDEVAAEPAPEAGEDWWDRVLAHVRDGKGGAAAFLAHARPGEVAEGKVTLLLGPGDGFHRTQLEQQEYREIVEAALRTVLGRRVRVAYEIREAEATETDPGPAAEDETARRLAREDPLVRKVCETFRGRVVQVRREDVGEETT